MTATNHALTGAVIAITVKRPEIAIPLAFLSHFALDLVPHYNPSGMTKDAFKSYSESWAKKMARKSFRVIFTADMVLFMSVLIFAPRLVSSNVSSWTVFLSSLAAASPDFDGGIRYLASLFKNGKEKVDNDWFTRFHIGIQGIERPWGLKVEILWAIAMILLAFHIG